MTEHEHRAFPSRLSFLLNNPLKRFFQSPKKVIEALKIKETDVVLDFGCGPGFYTIPIAKVAKDVFAVDIQQEMLEIVRKYADKEKLKIKFIQSDGQKIDLPDQSCDLIFLSFVYHELREKNKVLNEFLRILKPNGKIVIQEKIKKGLVPMGPPIIKLNNILDDLKTSSLDVVETIKMKNNILVIATKKH